MKALPAGNNIVLPRARIGFAHEDANGDLTSGVTFFGDVSQFTLTGSVNNTQVYSHTGPVREKILDIANQVDRTASAQLQHVSLLNLALFLMGNEGESSQASATGSTETFTGVQTERWYFLERTSSNPYGVQDVTSVSVNNDTTASGLTEGTDYELDAEDGGIFIKSGAGVSDGDDITVTYDKPSKTVPKIDSTDDAPREGGLYLYGDNAAGTNRNLFIPKMQVVPDGDLPWIAATEHQQIPLSFSLMKRDGYEQVYAWDRV